MERNSRDLPRHLHGRIEKNYDKAQHNEHLPITSQKHCILHQFARLHVILHLPVCIIVMANEGMVEKLRRSSTLPLKNLGRMAQWATQTVWTQWRLQSEPSSPIWCSMRRNVNTDFYFQT
jgi:hypothetical protein